MKAHIFTLLIGFLLFTAAGAWAQSSGSIEGTVTDESGEVMPGVNVTLVGTTKGAATDKSGAYEITGVNPGTYRIKASYLGYATFTSDPIEVSSGQSVSLDISLQQTVWRGDEVVVSGSKKPEKLLESPTTIERVSEEELQQSAGSTFMSSLA